jgi:hypothetical protein
MGTFVAAFVESFVDLRDLLDKGRDKVYDKGSCGYTAFVNLPEKNGDPV